MPRTLVPLVGLLRRLEACSAATAAPGQAVPALQGAAAHQLTTNSSSRSLHLAPPFLVDEPYTPVATTTYRLGRMPAKVAQAQAELEDCTACPRNCGVNRMKDVAGVCHVGRKAIVSTVAPHFGEEASLQGWKGSGTIFFSMCVFCQNWDISQQRAGYEMDAQELFDWMMKLQELEGGCHNINFVTPEHVAPQVAEAIAAAVERGLTLPIIYNSSSYDAVSSIKLMEGLVDIYLPDFKFWTEASSWRYAKARDYPECAKEAIQEMHRQVGDLVFTPDGLAKRGVLLRHLVMPGLLEEAKQILKWTAQELSKDTFINIMEQYHPNHLVGKGERRSRGRNRQQHNNTSDGAPTAASKRASDGSSSSSNDRHVEASKNQSSSKAWTTYDEIGHRPATEEVEDLRAFAESLGLWRFEEAPRWEAGGSAVSGLAG